MSVQRQRVCVSSNYTPPNPLPRSPLPNELLLSPLRILGRRRIMARADPRIARSRTLAPRHRRYLPRAHTMSAPRRLVRRHAPHHRLTRRHALVPLHRGSYGLSSRIRASAQHRVHIAHTCGSRAVRSGWKRVRVRVRGSGYGYGRGRAEQARHLELYRSTLVRRAAGGADVQV